MSFYIFDFDGTLVDSMPTFVRVMKGILDDADIAYGDDLVKTATPLGYGGTADYFISLGIREKKDELVEKMHQRALYDYANTIEAKPEVMDTLTELKRRGNSLNVLTASPHEVLDVCLKRLSLYDLFDNVWSCEDFGTTKGDPEIYKSAAKRLGACAADVTFLDDNIGACKTAKAAGVRVVGVFDESSADIEAEMRAVCDAYVFKLGELL